MNNNLKTILKKYWFFIGIAIVITCAFVFPSAAVPLKKYNLLKIAIAIAFLITGLKLQTRSIFSQIRNFKAIASAMLSCFVLFPAVAFVLAKLFFNDTDFIIGTCILAVAPVTIAAGTVISTMAAGNIPLSLFICVTSNLLAIFTIPLSLNLLTQLDYQIDLPALQMIKSLALIVLLPTVIGQIMRIKLKKVIAACSKSFSIFSQLVTLLIIFNACVNSAHRISQLGLAILSAVIFAIILHALILLLNFAFAKLIRLDLPSTATFTIHTSQKTLTISFVVWSTYFAQFPLALIPVVAYHLTQIIVDTFVAHRFKALADRKAAGS